MRPAPNLRGMVKATLMFALSNHSKSGRVSINCVVNTSKGVKVADVVWGSADFFARNKFETPYKITPELCLEIVSPSDSNAEMAQKRDLYFAKGAKEVWLCSLEGHVTFFNHYGEADISELFPDFPKTVDLPGR